MSNKASYKNYDAGRAEINQIIRRWFRGVTGSDYAGDITDRIFEDVVENVFTTSAVDESHDCLDYNEDDVKLAIGRVLLDHLEDDE